MGEEEGDPQRLKTTAAAAYDYDNDPRWAEYWSNILIPPHMAARSDVVDHFKRKFYQRFILLKLMYHVPVTNCWLSSECVGEDWSDCESIYLSLCFFLKRPHICSSEMVVKAEGRKVEGGYGGQ